MQQPFYTPMSRKDLAATIEGQAGRPGPVPFIYQYLIDRESFGQQAAAVDRILARYPDDAQVITLRMPEPFHAPPEDSSFAWCTGQPPADQAEGIDARPLVPDLADMGRFLEAFPDPLSPAVFADAPGPDGRYRLGYWWFFFFERYWQFRGMSGALVDLLESPREVHRALEALTGFYTSIITRGRREHRLDGIFVTDDLGSQRGPLFSREVFRAIFKPHYRDIVRHVHDLGMHFWLHSCGNVEVFLPELIDIGVDVIHPIQKHTMDERSIARAFGGKICIWAGFDVQRILPFSEPALIHGEAAFLRDTFRAGEGRLILGLGNAVNAQCSPERVTLLCEAMTQGRALGKSQSRSASC